MPEQPLWISEADVVALMDMRGAIAALEKGLREEAAGQAQNMVKTHVEWPQGGTLHAIGAVFPQVGLAGTKTWAHTPGGATPLVILYDSNTGALRAVVEAFALGQMRTAGASGLATRYLAVKDAGDFAILGSGKQAIAQLAAVIAVRPIRRVRVYSPNAQHRDAFAARVRKEFEIDVVCAGSEREALDGVPIITVVTRAKDPIVTSDMVARGAHINAVGAITPNRAELAADVIARASEIVADSVPQAQKLSRELMDFFAKEGANWSRVRPLSKLVADGAARRADADLTIFKSLGMGIADLSLAMVLYQQAAERGLGHKFPHPEKVAPRLRSVEPVKTVAGG